MANRLDPPADAVRAFGAAALDAAVRYYESLPDRPIMPETTAAAIRALIDEPLPSSGAEFDQVLETVDGVILPLCRHNGHRRFFGYVASPGTAVAAIADMLASVVNTNVTSWRSAPAPAEVEHVALRWIKEMLGYPADSGGLFVSGGSMANFAGLAAARSAKAPVNVTKKGMQAAGPRMRLYVSQEGHSSLKKAAALLGFGEENVQFVSTDGRFRIDLADLERRIQRDLAAGFLPACLIANAGTVATGAVDPIGEMAAIAREYNLWLHVDGAYGGFSALAPSAKPNFRDIAAADSVALDPHKWLYSSLGCGCVLYRDAPAARAAFCHDAEYTRVVGWRHDEAFAFWDYGPELSRRFRALAVWMLIKYAGAEALGSAVERNIACAKHMECLVRASADFEMLAPVELSIFCFRYRPAGFHGDLDWLNERILFELQRRGSSYLSNARLRGRFALRGCVLNYRTTEGDMETLLEDVRAAARSVMARA